MKRLIAWWQHGDLHERRMLGRDWNDEYAHVGRWIPDYEYITLYTDNWYHPKVWGRGLKYLLTTGRLPFGRRFERDSYRQALDLSDMFLEG